MEAALDKTWRGRDAFFSAAVSVSWDRNRVSAIKAAAVGSVPSDGMLAIVADFLGTKRQMAHAAPTRSRMGGTAIRTRCSARQASSMLVTDTMMSVAAMVSQRVLR